AEFGLIQVGQSITFVNQNGQSANLVVTAINHNLGTLTAQVTSVNANGMAGPIVFDPTPPAPVPPGSNYTAVVATPAETLNQFYADLITQVGLDAQTASTGTSTQTTLATNINSVRQGVDGINLDEESQNLIKYQTAYEAAAKTITVISTMLQTLLAMGGSTTVVP
ncbi:MAG: hypothetical protein JOY59_11390, partial [Candidatus Eremiobacteraeota bacterium]|nr:hypothetical protein [Candidatus Eremiobacteraeota bacterium]